MFKHSGKVQNGAERLIHRMITKERVKNEQIKRKQTSFVSFVKVFKFHEGKSKIVQKNF